ncbi:MAG: glutaredoxin domain-containing protein [Bacteroidota bacterium]
MDTQTQLMEIADSSQFDELIDNHELMMVLFYTASSALSKQSLEALEQLKQSHDEVPIYKVDASQVTDIHPRYDIQSVPTLVVFRKGRPAEIISGVQTAGFYEQILSQRSAGRDDDQHSPKVTVYTTPSCPYCNMVKDYLSNNDINFTEVDVASDQQAAQELVQRTGQQGVPQTEINGSFVIGYDTRELDRLLNL